MKNLHDIQDVDAITDRLDGLSAQAERQWGKMTPAQALAHCSIGMQMALGEVTPPRMPIGRLLGWLIKPLALGNDAPMKRNSPTVPAMMQQSAAPLLRPPHAEGMGGAHVQAPRPSPAAVRRVIRAAPRSP